MSKGYLVVTYRAAPDPDRVAVYAPLAKAAIEGAGGRFILRGAPVRTFENGLAERTVVAEFDSTDAAIAAYESDAYQEAVAALGECDRDFRVVEGV